METTFALVEPLGEAGVVLVALATAATFVVRPVRWQAGALAIAMLLAPVLLLGEVYSSGDLTGIPQRTGLAIAAIGLSLVAVAALAFLFLRMPKLFPIFAVAAVPFRVPIEFGGTSASLLLPLYLVVAAGCVSYLVETARQRPKTALARSPGAVEWAVAIFIIVYSLQALYSLDLGKALDQLVFFFVPFALLFKLLLRVDWTFKLVAWCGVAVVSMAAIFSLIGFWEYETRHLFWNSKVIDANQFSAYFRVNSVFFDPNIFGRFLAIAMLTVVAAMLWDTKRSRYALYAAVLVILWGGLLITFSQSSYGALLVGLAVLAGLRWSIRWTVISAAGAAVLAVVFVSLFPGAINLKLEKFKNFDHATSGRLKLVSGGIDLFAERPIYGYGSGSFNRAYREIRDGVGDGDVTASHNIAVTVAAEQGLIGFAAYLLLIVTAIYALFARLRAPPAREGLGYFAARCAVAAAFVGVVFHTMVYAAFLEDPTVWILLGIGLALARQDKISDRPTDEKVVAGV